MGSRLEMPFSELLLFAWKLCKEKKKRVLLDIDAIRFERNDVFLNPGSGLRLLSERRKHVVRDSHHNLDVSVSKRTEDRGIMVEELDLGDAIRAQEFHNNGRRERVGGLYTPVHT